MQVAFEHPFLYLGFLLCCYNYTKNNLKICEKDRLQEKQKKTVEYF